MPVDKQSLRGLITEACESAARYEGKLAYPLAFVFGYLCGEAEIPAEEQNRLDTLLEKSLLVPRNEVDAHNLHGVSVESLPDEGGEG